MAGVRYVGGGTTSGSARQRGGRDRQPDDRQPDCRRVVALGPTMTATGAVTTINFVKGDIRANNVTMGLGPGGTLSAVFRSTAGATTQLIFDVTGYFTPATTGATYHPLAPGRVLDTRPTGSGTPTSVSGVSSPTRSSGPFPWPASRRSAGPVPLCLPARQRSRAT